MPLLAGLLLVSAAGAGLADTAPSEVKFEDGAVAESLTGGPGDPEMGRKIMGSRSMGNCVACHAVSALSDVQWHGEVGPPLDGVGSRWSEAELRGIVANAKMMFPGSMMPSFYKTEGYIRPSDGFTGEAARGELDPILTAQQIEDVVSFLQTLQD
jgi:sulfur-oxidizing protein SoxX